MDLIAEVRRRHLISGESLSSIARSLNLSRNTVRKYLTTTEEPTYRRTSQPSPKLSPFKEKLITWLAQDADLPKKQRRTARRLYEGLVGEGYAAASSAEAPTHGALLSSDPYLSLHRPLSADFQIEGRRQLS